MRQQVAGWGRVAHGLGGATRVAQGVGGATRRVAPGATRRLAHGATELYVWLCMALPPICMALPPRAQPEWQDTAKRRLQS